MIRITCSVLLITLLGGCSFHEWNNDLWHYVQEQYPECEDKPMPDIYYSDKMEERGLYFKKLNWVIIKHPNDSRALAHEFKHICGDDQGELPEVIERII